MEQTAQVAPLVVMESSQMYFNSYRDGYQAQKEWIAWRIVDNNVKNVLINGKTANLISTKLFPYKVCYLIGNSKQIDPSLIETELY